MANRRAAYPGTMLQNMSLVPATQKSFGGGMNSDDPATEINPDELAEIINQIAFPKYTKGRTGCKLLHIDSVLPTLSVADYPSNPSNNTIRAYKVGNIVTLIPSGGLDVTDLVEGQYLVWTDDGTRDQITSITNPGTGDSFFTSAFYGDKSEQECLQQARIWGMGYSKQNDRILIHLGKKLYTINTVREENDTAFSRYDLMALVGNPDPSTLAESRSRFDVDDDQIILFNANGIFRVVLDEDSGYYFRINDGQPVVRIFEDKGLAKKKYVRNRIYTLARIIGPGVLYGDRRTADCIIQAESAPVLPDDTHADMSTGYTDIPIGPGEIQYDELQSGATVEMSSAVYKAYDDGAFAYKGTDFISDFTAALTMDDVCAAIQMSMRGVYPDAECFVRDGIVILVESKADKTVMEAITAPAAGTDITGLLQMAGTQGAVVTVDFDDPKMVYDLNTPEDRWTHYGIYEGEDGGVAGIALGNIPEELIWAADVPIIKTFRADRNTAHEITASNGEKLFSRYDKGSFLVWADDLEPEKIMYLVSPLDDSASKNATEIAVIGNGLGGTSTDKTDVPIAIGAKKIGQAYQANSVVTLDSTYAHRFDVVDIGKILFLEDGSVRHILNVDADGSTECVVHEDIDFGSGGTSPMYEAVAWDPIMRTNIADPELGDNKLVVFDKTLDGVPTTDKSLLHRIGGAPIDASDVGRRLYLFYQGELITDWWYDVYSLIGTDQLSLNANGVSFPIPSWFLAEMKNMTGIIVDVNPDTFNFYPPARFFNDTVTDDDLESRADDPYFLLQTRFFRPLPSSCVGALGSNFMFVAEQTTNKIAYSEMPEQRKFIVGFYHPTWQADSKIQDEITYLKNYPDRMIAFGKAATWGSNTSAFTSIKQPAIGEEIFTVPQFTIVENKGFSHLDSIQDIAADHSILMCSDASIRTFNGRQYSVQDYSDGKVHDILRLWHNRVMSSYDGTGGYMIFGSPNVNSDERNFVNMVEGSCYRLALLPSQGSWWSRYAGLIRTLDINSNVESDEETMVSPMPYTGGKSIYDDNDMEIQVMLDERTGQWYQINTYNGPAGSGLVESLEDKGGAEIVCSMKGKEHRGQRLSIDLEHMESHVHIVPQVQGGAYRAGFAITSKIYVDNSITYHAKTVDTPIDGDVVYDRKAKSKHIQSEFEFSTSGFIISELETIYVTKDTAGATAALGRETSESGHQRLYNRPIE